MFRENSYQVIELMNQTVWNLASVKNYMRVTSNYDDDLITSLIDTAIIVAENFTKLTIISKRVKFTGNVTNQQNLQLKFHPLRELIKITLINATLETTLQNDQYYIDHENSILSLDKTLEDEKLIVEYIAGFDEKNVPLSIKHGILLHIAEMYDREGCNSTVLSTEIKNLYFPYRQLRI